MACGCKNKVQEIEKKYGNGETNEDKTENIILLIVQNVLQFLFGVICGFIIILLSIPIILYIIVHLILGKTTTFDITKIINFLKKNN